MKKHCLSYITLLAIFPTAAYAQGNQTCGGKASLIPAFCWLATIALSSLIAKVLPRFLKKPKRKDAMRSSTFQQLGITGFALLLLVSTPFIIDAVEDKYGAGAEKTPACETQPTGK